jgi:hypothetical protein
VSALSAHPSFLTPRLGEMPYPAMTWKLDTYAAVLVRAYSAPASGWS